jgi:hypothetical protein
MVAAESKNDSDPTGGIEDIIGHKNSCTATFQVDSEIWNK